jgi:cysteine desulfurase
MQPPIYLDYNATTPLDPLVADAMRPYLDEHFGNPSSGHWYGEQTREAVTRARAQVADLVGAHTGEIVLTSGGSEANNHALKGAARANRHRGDHIITTAIEHPAVTGVCAWLAGEGFTVTTLPVDEYGIVDAAGLRAAITPRTILLSVMHANNETGSIQPVRELADIAHEHGVVVHSDAAQSVGKIPVDVDELGVDLLSIAGHKFYGPKGVGALYIRDGVAVEKLIHGASHERDRRAGTENILAIVGLGVAAELAGRRLHDAMRHGRELRDLLHERLRAGVPGLRLNGHPEQRLPNTLNVSFPDITAAHLLAAVPQVAASPGAACHAGHGTVSSVMAAMGVPPRVAAGMVRFSTGRLLTTEQVEEAARLLIAAVNQS